MVLIPTYGLMGRRQDITSHPGGPGMLRVGRSVSAIGIIKALTALVITVHALTALVITVHALTALVITVHVITAHVLTRPALTAQDITGAPIKSS